MHFCPKCERVMVQSVATGDIVWHCTTACGETRPGSAMDACVSTVIHGGGDTEEMYQSLIRNAAFDRTNQLVARLCTKCGRDYMTQIRIGDDERVVYTCRCGVILSGAAALQDPSSGAAALQDPSGAAAPQDPPGAAGPAPPPGNIVTGGGMQKDAKAAPPAKDVKTPSAKTAAVHVAPANDAKTGTAAKTAKVAPPAKIAPSTQKPNAWVTLVMKGDGYTPGALVLGQSLRSSGTAHRLVCMVTPDVSPAARQALAAIFDAVVEVPYIRAKNKPMHSKKQNEMYAWMAEAHTKWNLLGLTDYGKVLFVDADKIMLTNCDELFAVEAPAATFSSPWRQKPFFSAAAHGAALDRKEVERGLDAAHSCIGSAVLVAPDADDYRAYTAWLKTQEPYGHPENFSGSDEQSITEFYAKVKKATWHMIGKQFNAIPWKLDWLAGEPPRTYEYFNTPKPWQTARDTWPDFEPWWCFASIAVAAAPSLAGWFTPGDLGRPARKHCPYCAALKKPADHFLVAGGVAVCPIVAR